MVQHVDRFANVISLCSGVGGLELGLRLAFSPARTVCYVEREASAIGIMAARMQEKTLDPAPVWTDLRTFDGKPWRGVVDIVTAGYPCQPFSTMGKRRGKSDPRHLWPEVRRVVDETRPLLFFAENVPNHVRIGLSDVVSDLESIGYESSFGLFTAAEVGLSQVRKRLFILAHAKGEHASGWECEQVWGASLGGRAVRVDSAEQGEAGPLWDAENPPPPSGIEDWRRVLADNLSCQPAFFGKDDELASGLDESILANKEEGIRCLGNGVVPSCAAYAFCILLGRLQDHITKPR